jgi:hypothetical protein
LVMIGLRMKNMNVEIGFSYESIVHQRK